MGRHTGGLEETPRMNGQPVLIRYSKVPRAARRETWGCLGDHKCQKGRHDCPVVKSQHLGVHGWPIPSSLQFDKVSRQERLSEWNSVGIDQEYVDCLAVRMLAYYL